tara:strand:+ start:1522 stop:1752 length:231 start_codon:yes stop_codon:yes gene_type:complete
MEKLTSEELMFLQEATSKLSNAKTMLGDLEIKKHEVLSEVSTLKVMVQTKEQELINKYGLDSVINMETGQVKKKEK